MKCDNHDKLIRYCYIKGDKGEKGEKGESTFSNITVGSTETVESNESAEVSNVGDERNVILNFKIPKGADGKDGSKGEKGEKGENGISENIIVDGAQTIDDFIDASVVDDFKDNTHHLTFYIPKGEQGPAGPAGAGSGVTSFSDILYVGCQDTTISKSLTIKEKIFLPDSTRVFKVPTTVAIDIGVTGIYEIMLCGKINGVTEKNGAKVFLLNTTTGTVINNLSFELKEGTTSTTHFSGTTITQIFAPATFEIKSSISSDPSTASITFSDVNLIIKKYNI